MHQRRGCCSGGCVSRIGAPIACHAEAVREGRLILLCGLRFRRGARSFAWLLPRLWSSSVTNSTGFLLLFGSGRIALTTFLAFLTQLLLVQIGLVLFIGKTTAETSGGNGQCRRNFYRTATRYHMPWAFIQRIRIRKRKLTTTRSTFMRHILSYRGWLRSSNAEVATRARCRPPKRIRRSQARSRSPKQTILSHQCIEPRSTLALALVETVASCEWRPRFYSSLSIFPVIWRIVFDVQTLRSFFCTSDA